MTVAPTAREEHGATGPDAAPAGRCVGWHLTPPLRDGNSVGSLFSCRWRGCHAVHLVVSPWLGWSEFGSVFVSEPMPELQLLPPAEKLRQLQRHSRMQGQAENERQRQRDIYTICAQALTHIIVSGRGAAGWCCGAGVSPQPHVPTALCLRAVFPSLFL